MKGLVAYSFALGKKEPNPCNMRLAREVARLVKAEKDEVVVVSQWEVAEALPKVGIEPNCIVERHRQQGAYLDSEEVTAQAAQYFRKAGVNEVIPVANPFLHLAKCRKLLGDAGFSVLDRKVRWIGFYPDSLQWWTRGPIRLLVYAVLQIVFGRRGK